MLVALRTLNNITAYRLLSICYRVLSDHYQHQTTNKLEMLLEQKDLENIAKIATAILLTISRHIRLTRLLEFAHPNAKYDSAERKLGGATSVDWSDDGEIEKAIAAADNNEDDHKEDF